MKSSWRSPDGRSSVARNAEIEPCGAVFCAWWGTGSAPIRTFHTVSEKLFANSGSVPNGGSESGQEGSKKSLFGRLLPPERRAERPSPIFQTVSEGGFSELRWAAPGEYDVLVTWATRGEVPRVGRREQGSSPPTSALGRPPPPERLAAHPPDGCCRLPRLVSGRPHPRAGAAHLCPDSRRHHSGACGR